METTRDDVNVASHYTERLAMLPTLPTWQARQSQRKPAARGDFGIPEDGALYFCPHRPPKYHPDFDDYLRGVLEGDSTGHLVLLCGKHGRASTLLQQRLSRSLGNSLLNRVVFLPALQLDQYYQLLKLATVVLDSPAYAGGITAYDAFSFGVPIVSQAGDLAVQNYTSGLYRRMGVSGLTAHDRQSYVDIAVRLGTEPTLRNEVVEQLTETSGLIFEDPRVTASFEQFFHAAAHNSHDIYEQHLDHKQFTLSTTH